MNNPNVSLRPLRSSDAETLAILANNRKIWDNVRDLFPHPYTTEHAREFIGLKKEEHPTLTFAILSESALAGVIGLEPKADVFRKTAIVGYWLGEPYWGKGIATEALRLIIDYAFNELDLVRLEAGHFDFNPASGKVLKKCGFKQFGIAQKSVIKNGKLADDHLYGLVNPKYQ